MWQSRLHVLNDFELYSKRPYYISQVPGVLERPEKINLQKWHHPMFLQSLVNQKNQKSKFFNEPFFSNRHFCIFPYVKLEAIWRKNGSLWAVCWLILFKNGLNSLLIKHWHRLKVLRIQICSVQSKKVSKIWFLCNI